MSERLNALISELREEAVHLSGRPGYRHTVDLLDEAADALREAVVPPPATGWQPIATAPEAEYVFVYIPSYGINIATMTRDPAIKGKNADWWFVRGESERCYPTLWCPLSVLPPLPASPAAAGTEQT